MRVRSSLLRFSTLVSAVSLGVLSPGVCSPAPGTRAQRDLRVTRKSHAHTHNVRPVERIISLVELYKSSDATKAIVDR